MARTAFPFKRDFELILLRFRSASTLDPLQSRKSEVGGAPIEQESEEGRARAANLLAIVG